MKTVEFTTDMRPWRAGDRVPLPDDVADRLVASEEAKEPRPFGIPASERPRNAYLTKGVKK